MRRRALLCAAATVLAGCGGSVDETADTTARTTRSTDATTARTTTERPAERPLELAEHELVRTNEGSADELAIVVGTVRNDGDPTVEDVVVTATFRDDDGATLDTASAELDEFAPGEAWTFELTYPGVGDAAREVADYSLTVVLED